MLRRPTALFFVLATAATAHAQTSTPEPETGTEELRGPANNVVFEATGGYGVGAFGAIDGHDPAVAHGPLFHVGAGWAWPLRTNQSLGVLLFGDGQFDGDHTTASGAQLASRVGAAAALWGEHAHLRLGVGWAHATLADKGYGGLGIVFGAGWQTTITEGTKKHGVFMFEVLPSWDFLGAGNQTLHRWNFGILIGVAVL